MRTICLLLLVLCFPVNATDKAREKRWAEQTIDMIFEGEPVYLDVPGHRFLSIYTESEAKSVNGLIILHGTGFHPDYEKVVRPLRVEMTLHGWHTLSIQLPLLASDADYLDYVSVYPEVPPRIDAATALLADKGITNIGIVAHSQGATMASYYVAQNQNNISSLVLIGMSAQHTDKNINSAESLKKIDIPTLDIFGSKDFPAVLQTAELRKTAASGNAGYQQSVIDGAYHFFDFREDELLEFVATWLDQYQQ